MELLWPSLSPATTQWYLAINRDWNSLTSHNQPTAKESDKGSNVSGLEEIGDCKRVESETKDNGGPRDEEAGEVDHTQNKISRKCPGYARLSTFYLKYRRYAFHIGMWLLWTAQVTPGQLIPSLEMLTDVDGGSTA